MEQSESTETFQRTVTAKSCTKKSRELWRNTAAGIGYCGYRLCQAAEASLVRGPGSRRKHADKDAQKSYPAEINFHP